MKDEVKLDFSVKVRSAAFVTSEEVHELIEQTENVYINELEDGNRRKAMQRLRVLPMRSQETVTFWLGFLLGWFGI